MKCAMHIFINSRVKHQRQERNDDAINSEFDWSSEENKRAARTYERVHLVLCKATTYFTTFTTSAYKCESLMDPWLLSDHVIQIAKLESKWRTGTCPRLSACFALQFGDFWTTSSLSCKWPILYI